MECLVSCHQALCSGIESGAKLSLPALHMLTVRVSTLASNVCACKHSCVSNCNVAPSDCTLHASSNKQMAPGHLWDTTMSTSVTKNRRENMSDFARDTRFKFWHQILLVIRRQPVLVLRR